MKYLNIILLLFVIQTSYSQNPYFKFESSNYNELGARFESIGDRLYIEYSTYYSGPVYKEFFKTNQFIIDEYANILYQNEVSNDYPAYNEFITKSVYLDSAIYSCGVLADYANNDYKLFIRKSDIELNLIKDTIVANEYISITDMIISDSTILAVGPSFDTSVNILRFNTNLELLESTKFNFLGYLFFGYEFIKDDILKFSNFIAEECWLKIDSNLNIIDTIYNNMYNSGHFYEPSTYNMFLNDSVFLSPGNYFKKFGTNPDDSTYSQIGWNKWSIEGDFLDTVVPFKNTPRSDYFGVGKCMIKYTQDSIIMAFSINMNSIDIRTDSSSIGLIWSDLEGNVSKTLHFGGYYCYIIEDLHRFNNGNILVAARRKLWSQSAAHNTYDEVIYLLNKDGDIIQEINISEKIANEFLVYPNPARDYINISDNINIKEINNYSIYNIQGKLLKSNYLNNNKISISELSKGIYILEVEFKDNTKRSTKFIKN